MITYKIGCGKRIPRKVFLFDSSNDTWCFATLPILDVLAKVWDNELWDMLGCRNLLWERYGIYEKRMPGGITLDDVRTAYLIARDELIDRGEEGV